MQSLSLAQSLRGTILLPKEERTRSPGRHKSPRHGPRLGTTLMACVALNVTWKTVFSHKTRSKLPALSPEVLREETRAAWLRAPAPPPHQPPAVVLSAGHSPLELPAHMGAGLCKLNLVRQPGGMFRKCSSAGRGSGFSGCAEAVWSDAVPVATSTLAVCTPDWRQAELPYALWSGSTESALQVFEPL